ncbi:esterase-5B isoform X2 [Hyalella azteca]|uniref:Esterase-5B isoform X1 n=1 Tax=Hyalella azteca TaxID=294128 RepID=A0A8B7N387_HYAAZ|nr:esterase-5B isoform X1 [Hyalella azteca]XP_018007694.1 esterase-5B isoform X2 [Hyalella azteca]
MYSSVTVNTRISLLFLLLFAVSYYSVVSASYDAAPPRVVTPKGTYIGKHIVSGRQKRNVFAFTGIPYAKPPLGDLRFAYPERLTGRLGEHDATSPSPECLQWDHLRMRGVVGVEDCLYLDIYTNWYPAIVSKVTHQPIVVFVHAGSWLAGGGAQDWFTADYLIENDVVVVNINHRLGALGFLSTEDRAAPGNYAMRDVILALEWIRENAWFFGGTNDTVTVMGSGAGGTTTHLLTLSPLARGASTNHDDYSLLARAISQSGTAYSPHAISRDARAQAFALARTVGCPAGLESVQLIHCLRNMDANAIVGQIPTLFKWDEEPLPFGPVIDTWMMDEAFLPDEPHRLIHNNKFLQIPWMCGTNRDDGAFRVRDILHDDVLVRQLNTDWDRVGPVLLHLTKDSCKDPVAVARQIRQYYIKDKKFGDESSKEFVEMMTDRFFVYPTEKAMRDHCSRLQGQYTWCYRYVLDFCGRKSFLDILQQDTADAAAKEAFGFANPRFQNTRDAHGWGVGFMDELLFLFPSPKLKLFYAQQHSKDTSSSVSTSMIMLWTNFIKGGDPTPLLPGYPDDVSPWGTWWEPYYVGYDIYLKIDPDMESRDTPYRAEQRQFWDSLPLFENRDHNIIRDEL